MLPVRSATLPHSRTRAVSVFALFVAVQIADAAMTLAAVRQFGPMAEGNPILAFYITTCGAVKALAGAKCGAIALGAALHARAYYLVLAVLTLLYVVAAVDMWAFRM